MKIVQMFQENVSPPTAVSSHKAATGVRQCTLSVEKKLNAFLGQQKNIFFLLLCLLESNLYVCIDLDRICMKNK